MHLQICADSADPNPHWIGQMSWFLYGFMVFILLRCYVDGVAHRLFSSAQGVRYYDGIVCGFLHLGGFGVQGFAAVQPKSCYSFQDSRVEASSARGVVRVLRLGLKRWSRNSTFHLAIRALNRFWEIL